MAKTIDFDAFRAERADTEEPLKLRLGGKDYDLPASLPAALALDIARIQATKGDEAEFDESDVMRLGAALFGGEARFVQILSEGAVTIDEMPDLTKMVLEMYGGTVSSPNRKTRREAGKPSRSRSSKSGRSSRQTS